MRTFRPSYIKAPDNAHPLVKRLFQEMARQRIGLADLADRAGMKAATISSWRKKHNPELIQIEACFVALGFELQVKRIEKESR